MKDKSGGITRCEREQYYRGYRFCVMNFLTLYASRYGLILYGRKANPLFYG